MVKKVSASFSLLHGSALLLLGIGLGVAIGWWMALRFQPPRDPVTGAQLRVGGYDFISPLIACDSPADRSSESLADLERDIRSQLAAHTQQGWISGASVLVRRLTTGEQVSINGSEKFFPASLKKVPLMMTYYKLAETRPSLLQTRGVVTGSTDYNQGVEIAPDKTPVFGEEYSIESLIEYMITHSDNNSLQILSSNVGESGLRAIYDELQIEYPNDSLTITDFLTAPQFSLFLRSLYNASYLTEAYSERALSLMSQVVYRNGIRAGLPDTAKVAHKFGVITEKSGETIKNRELHDCGIVYHTSGPYVVCVMTKSNNALSDAERVIADVSRTVFQAAERGW